MDFLRRSIDLNGFLRRTRLEQVVLNDTDDKLASLYIPHNEPKNASVVEPGFVADAVLGSLINVRTATLDQLCQSCERVDFIKIDAEGAEEHIFDAMQETIERHKPMIVMEFNVRRYPNSAEFARRLKAVYGTLRHLDFKGQTHVVTLEQLSANDTGDDWLLVLSAHEPA